MISYHLSLNKAHRQIISFSMAFEAERGETINLQLPRWRPGRYEFADYAGNILQVSAFDDKGKELEVIKTEQYVWTVKATRKTEVTFSYDYYAALLNAGSTFVDETQLYVNPVNCFFYLKGREEEPYEVRFDLLADYRIAGMLSTKGGVMKAKNMDELFDSPFIASDSLSVHAFKEAGIVFSIVIQGDVHPDWTKIEADFRPFIKAQVQAFGSCPVDEYLFLIQSPLKRQYHGVEHQGGTVLTLGPSNEFMIGKTYYDLLAISSHELYHTWNVKYIRPEEMYPYDFSQENYHRIGYIIEGVTTYQGDLKMWQSGVITDEQFMAELQIHLDRHLSNAGRHNLSVRESSFDLWVDGYKKSTPDRKVSIYTEGALVALITDIELIRRTKGKFGLDEVMKRLYEKYAKKEKGYSEKNYLGLLDEVGGKGLAEYVTSLVDNAVCYETEVIKALRNVEVTVERKAVSIMASYFGLQLNSDPMPRVLSVHPDSHAYEVGIRPEMIIMGVEGNVLTGNIEQWVSHHKNSGSLTFLVQNGGQYAQISLAPSKDLLFRTHRLSLPPKQKENGVLRGWRKVLTTSFDARPKRTPKTSKKVSKKVARREAAQKKK